MRPRIVIVALAAACLLWGLCCAGSPRTVENWQQQRLQMVKFQIEDRGVRDGRVLAAMREVPRHELVPANVRAMAYWDTPLPIGLEQTISQPYIVAYMTQALGLRGHERVLEIGTGSGYQAAVLSRLVPQVYTIEILCQLADRARADLTRLGYDNVNVRCGDGYLGWPERAPFDAIIVTAAPPTIPAPLIEQLAVGGTMVLPVGEGFQKLVLVRKGADGVVTRDLIPVSFVPMTGPLGSQTPTPQQESDE